MNKYLINADNPYTEFAGQNEIENATKDKFGNAEGNQYDLVRDGAFNGLQISVLQLYTASDFDFSEPTKALSEKGFSIVKWANTPPSIDEFKKQLEKSCQLWIIADKIRKLTEEYIEIIKAFFDKGHGLYIWGDNDPFYADANVIAQRLFNTTMQGCLQGEQTIKIQTTANKRGFIPNHQITTGLEFIYEGVTIATIQPNNVLQPLLFGSANNLVSAIYNKDGKRAILDGGFTRLYVNWHTAGTGRYVKNASSWLVNYERFAKDSIQTSQVVSKNLVASISNKFDKTETKVQQEKSIKLNSEDIISKF